MTKKSKISVKKSKKVSSKHQTGGIPKPFVPKNTLATDATQDAHIGLASDMHPLNINNNQQQLSNPGVYQQPGQQGFSFKNALNIGGTQESPYTKLANGAMSFATGIGNTIQNSRQRHEEQLQMIEGMTPKYFTNMEGEGLNNVPAFTMYGGNSDRSTYYGGGMHGEGRSSGVENKSVGPNFRQYSRGIESDISSERTESDVPVADKPGMMPQRYQNGGAGWDDDQVLFMMYGGVDFGVPQDYSNMTNEDYGYTGIGHNGPWGQNSVYRTGGSVSSSKAKEILRDGTAQGHPLTDKQRRYFGWIAGGSKAQTGGAPTQQQPVQQQQPAPTTSSPEDYYKASATLSYYKDKLNGQLKTKNPQGYGDYFKGLVDLRKQGNTKGAQDYTQNSQYNDYLSPDEVKKTLGSDKDYQNYLNSLKAVNNYNVSQGQQPLYGNIEGQNDDPANLNYGRRFASLQVTPSFGKTLQSSSGDKHYNRNYKYNPQTGNVDFTEVGDTSIRPEGFAAPGQQVSGQEQNSVSSKKYGGNKYQTGGSGKPKVQQLPSVTVKGIRVSDPKDKRLANYQDSVRAYNSYTNLQNFVKEHPDLNKVNADPKLAEQYGILNDLNGEGNWGKGGDNQGTIQPTQILHPYPGQVDEMWKFDKPKQPFFYKKSSPQPTIQPKREVFNHKQIFNPYNVETTGQKINVPEPGLIPQSPIGQDPTNFSFTGRDDNGQQVTRYFPDIESWQNATNQMGYSHREITNNGKQANATGYQFQAGGYAIGDEIEMSISQIEALRKQGYKIEEI